MTRIELLKTNIDELYLKKDPNREDWADWLHATHIYVVSEYAKRIAQQHNASADVAMAGAMLHDIADVVMSRFDPRHEEESYTIARKLLNESGFSNGEIKIIVDDAIRYHSCHDNISPKSLEGKIVATSDALAHLKTDFYPHVFSRKLAEGKTKEEIKQWALPKLERDFRVKIFFEDIRKEAEPYYIKLKTTVESF